jgi:hypothetical protein
MEPRDVLKKADALLVAGDAQGAVAYYKTVAQFYAAQGFALKSIAVWKQILAIPGFDAEARPQLITLYRSLGLEHDARALEEG